MSRWPTPARWPVVPRPVLSRLAATLQSGSGVALIGNEGVGKTTLAAQLAGQIGGGDPVWVIGTAAQSLLPFGAFGPLIDVHDAGKPAALIRTAAESLLARVGSAPIIVDNARLLDPLSASLVYHLAGQAPQGRLIVTVRSVLRAPQVVTALWQDGLLERSDVSPFDAAETAAVVAAAGGDQATPGGEPAVLYRRSAGNALHLRLLLTTGGTEDTLAAAIDRYLAELPEPVRDVLGYLCVFEPLERTDLAALTDETAVAAAEQAGAVESRDTRVYSGHPLFLERLAATMDRGGVTRRRTDVATRLAEAGPDAAALAPAARLGRTLLTLQSEAPVDLAGVVAAADEALRLGDLGLAERLAAGALERRSDDASDGLFAARLALSNALAWQGRGREADAVLAAVDTAGLTDEQMMAWALPRAANQFWMLSEPERATSFLHNIRGRIGTAPARLTLDALSATFAMNAGNVGRAADVAGEVLARSDAPPTAVAWAASAAALCSARMGRLADVGPLVDRALASDHPGLLRFTVGLAETTALVMAGKPRTAEEAARRFTDFAELAQPGRAIGEVLLAGVLLDTGDAAGAAGLLGPASATLERTGYSWGPLALMYLTTALAHLGEIAESSKTLSRALDRHGTKSALFAPELGLARAWRLATIGDRAGAVTLARDAARLAERAGQHTVAVRCWQAAVRLGDRRAATGLSPIADRVDCEFTRMTLDHARAMTAGDAAGLGAVAARWSSAGFAGAAADAAGQARDAGRDSPVPVR